ncbi:MAG: periplasmic heavy metal sensor [Acidobacteria bacterium]|nr:periplasmic heavy metal sensor [Acidobacteriota bacterium]
MAGVLAAVMAAVLVAPPLFAEAQQQQRWKWWQDEKSRVEIGLTDEQSGAVEEVFQAALPKLKAAKAQLDLLQADLSRMIRERTADESLVAAHIDKVEAARAELSKTRTLMLYRMHRILTPEQNTRLQAIHDRWEKERGRSPRRPESR